MLTPLVFTGSELFGYAMQKYPIVVMSCQHANILVEVIFFYFFLVYSSQVLSTHVNKRQPSRNNMTNKPAYLRPLEAAAYISTSLSSIYRLMQAKQLKSYKVNGTRLIKVADLESLVEANAA